MKLVLASDLHGYLPKIPPCDTLVLAGDILPDTDQFQFVRDKLSSWLDNVPAMNVVATWGNHDWLPFIGQGHSLTIPWTLLLDQSLKVGNTLFYGTPWCLPSSSYSKWAWQAPESSLEKLYAGIPNETDVLICHTPPYGICDLNYDRVHVGSRALKSRIEHLPSLKLLDCGHIHDV